MYKVFIENRAVEFVNSQKIAVNSKAIDAQAIQNIEQDLSQLLSDLDSNECVSIYCDDIKKDWERLFQGHQFVHAAGGLVKNDNQWLVIKRHGMLDLPKGHLEENEQPAIGAEREIAEECGVFSLQLKGFSCSTFHTYYYEGKPVLKKTDWFLFDHFGTASGTPQLEEGIEAVLWMKEEEMKISLDQFYTSIQFVIKETIKL